MSAGDDFNVELLKLLLQVSWADGEVQERERQLIQGLGRSWTVPEQTLEYLLDRLAKGHPLPPPNFKVLKPRLDDVLEAVHALVAADGRDADEEKEMVEQIRAMLG